MRNNWFQHPDVEHDDITVDAYVVVFSVIDPGSFKYAISTVRRLRMEARTSHAIVLVGNKIDLVRQRRITKHGKPPEFRCIHSYKSRSRILAEMCSKCIKEALCILSAYKSTIKISLETDVL